LIELNGITEAQARSIVWLERWRPLLHVQQWPKRHRTALAEKPSQGFGEPCLFRVSPGHQDATICQRADAEGWRVSDTSHPGQSGCSWKRDPELRLV